jgi:UDP-N-acetyl-D-mannosaminuronic acid dehydrogenase
MGNEGSTRGDVAKWLRQGSAKPLFSGSNPLVASTINKVAVIGMGYVGIPVAVLLAEAGFDVTGLQRRSKRSGWKIDWLNEGRCPISNEPELPEILKRTVTEGKFRATDDYSVLKGMEIIFIDVQTPVDDSHIPQYESLKEVCQIVGKYLAPGKIVVIESTVAPGTTENLVKPILEQESHLKAGLPLGFGLCFSYERVMVGRLVHNNREYPKIVGGIDGESTAIATEIYKKIVKGGVYGTDLMTAEISKTVENAYRDVQIAFANEIALICESMGVNVYDVRKFVNGLPDDTSEPHANPVRNMHFPGAGVGGHCLPKDSWLLIHGYENHAPNKDGYRPSILIEARHINDWMPIHMADLLETALKEANKSLQASTIGVLGYAFLENSDDARNTPTVPFLRELEKRGARYRIHDPFVKYDNDYQIESNIDSALKDCDAVVLMTKHDEYMSLDPGKFESLLKTKVIIDGRNLWQPAAFLAKGFIMKGIGKGDLNRRT